jgi:hypothetical protein
VDNTTSNLIETEQFFLSIDWYPESLTSLDDLPFLTPLQLGAFWGLLVAFTTAYNIKVLLSGYQSIDMKKGQTLEKGGML